MTVRELRKLLESVDQDLLVVRYDEAWFNVVQEVKTENLYSTRGTGRHGDFVDWELKSESQEVLILI